RGTGSGMIVSRAGHILTNVHVVETSESIVVTLHDKRTYEAAIIGIDPLTEIALIKIDADHVQPVTMGNSDHCRVGEWVLAIGNPLELNATITAGIISAKGREINIISDMYGVENFIQTDAAINPGNSGGPLINLKGEVIGITTAIATENGYSQGYGFAIPINLAREIMNDLVRFGKVTRGYLGISMQDIDEKRARALGLKKPFGVFVDTVSEDGPAYAAGLRERDVLIKIDETSVNQSNSVQSIIVQKDPGKEIVLTVLRKNKLLKLKTTLGVRQSYTNLKKATKTKVQYLYLGLQVESTKRDLSAELGIRSAHGLIVSAVQQYSPAFEAGIQVNDMILEIGEEVIHSIEQFQTIMSSLRPGDVLIMKINRENTIFHAFVEVPLQ
ncbi:trypsin-like peptidase domain-containing protein, partial [candidate division KSB1 bacterium]|nr:trypsin-like peptidase domain-containing protein [candidate division KSB1 bacterium]